MSFGLVPSLTSENGCPQLSVNKTNEMKKFSLVVDILVHS